MKPEDRQKFLVWYEEHKNDYFHAQRDIVEYCVSDVEILTQAWLKFRAKCISEGNICPFSEVTTLLSKCNIIFRRNYLKPNTVGIIPKNGYRWRDNQSKIATQWLLWEEKLRKVNIIHAAKGNEATIAGLKVDGYCAELKQVFEFHGCYYHGCPSCIRHGRHKPTHDNPVDTMESRFESTQAKTERLRRQGYEVVEMWECVFRRQLNTNEEIKRYTEKHPLLITLPLNPREAFYGGRTGAAKMYHKIGADEKIRYMDICSLYPWVCKYGKYPVGHPRVYVGQDCKQLNITEIDGLIKCKILPPQNLYHPVLPVKMNEKLMFSLCRTCAEEQNDTDECYHGEAERVLDGTWVVDEVLKAIEKGYKILDIYEVWHYEIEQYNKVSGNGGLFTGYINDFLKIKQQASGWPSNCKTQEEKQRYISDYTEHEGVQLKSDDIEVNPALRQLGKAVITSFWGKMGQRENQGKTEIVNDPQVFFELLTDPAKNVNTVLPVNENTLVVNWEFKEEAYDVLPTVNVCMAAYTTAQARLKLYSYLEKLEDRVLYYDTDSVIYVSKEGEYDIPTGSMLGEMTDELEEYGPESYISEFASGGPKLYAYIVHSPSKNEYYEICKVKGICINHKVSKAVNFKILRDMIINGDDDKPPIYITSQNIRRTEQHQVVTVEEKKIFRVNFRKRRRIENYDSVPYGFKRPKLC